MPLLSPGLFMRPETPCTVGNLTVFIVQTRAVTRTLVSLISYSNYMHRLPWFDGGGQEARCDQNARLRPAAIYCYDKVRLKREPPGLMYKPTTCPGITKKKGSQPAEVARAEVLLNTRARDTRCSNGNFPAATSSPTFQQRGAHLRSHKKQCAKPFFLCRTVQVCGRCNQAPSVALGPLEGMAAQHRQRGVH